MSNLPFSFEMVKGMTLNGIALGMTTLKLTVFVTLLEDPFIFVEKRSVAVQWQRPRVRPWLQQYVECLASVGIEINEHAGICDASPVRKRPAQHKGDTFFHNSRSHVGIGLRHATVYVSCLGNDVTDTELSVTCSEFGPVISSRVFPNKQGANKQQCGLATFREVLHAQAAIEHLRAAGWDIRPAKNSFGHLSP